MAYDLLTKKQSPRSWALGASTDVGAPWLVYDDEIMKELNDLRRDVDGLNVDFTGWIKTKSKDPHAQSLWKNWVAFRDDVYGTYKKWTDTTLLMPGGAAHSLIGRRKFYDVVKNLQEQFLKWRETFQKTTGQEPSIPAASERNKDESSSGGFWKWLAIAGLGAAGGLLVAKKLEA
jgi:hypothetical protein